MPIEPPFPVRARGRDELEAESFEHCRKRKPADEIRREVVSTIARRDLEAVRRLTPLEPVSAAKLRPPRGRQRAVKHTKLERRPRLAVSMTNKPNRIRHQKALAQHRNDCRVGLARHVESEAIHPTPRLATSLSSRSSTRLGSHGQTPR